MYCTWRLFDDLAVLMRESPELTVKVVWQNFFICNALMIVEESVREITQSPPNGTWQKLRNKVVMDSESFLPVVEEIENVASVKCLGGCDRLEDIE